ncbi:Heat shock 70 kDa protein BIP1 [Linum perenne]
MKTEGEKIDERNAIGIDLGTTFSCVAVANKEKDVDIIANDDTGNRTTPSYVAFRASDSTRLIGEAAKSQASINPRGTVFDVKRFIGKKFDDPSVQKDLKFLPYKVVNIDGKPRVEVEVKPGQVKAFTPEEISAMVLRSMKESAESYLGNKVTDAVVTVPAYFNDAQRQATKDAAKIAGLNVLQIINEPTAAAVAYGLNKLNRRKRKRKSSNKCKILVYDLGGGTFDVSIVEIEDHEFRVLVTGGDTHLGGVDFDNRVMNYFIEKLKAKHGKDIRGDNKALGKLIKRCEEAKRALSNQMEVRVEIDSFLDGDDFSEPLSRSKFEGINMDLFRKTLDVVGKTLKAGKIKKSEIDELVLVGGSTRIPKLRQMLKQMFNGKEPNQGVNPDEAVAYGAAVLAANLIGKASPQLGVTLSDITPLSLGISVQGDLMSVVIPRHTPIPVKMSNIYYTSTSQQTSIEIKVFQGERVLTKDCLQLGSFDLDGIPPAPRGVANVEVTFEISVDGILNIMAKDNATANSESLTITNYKGNLNEEELQRMIEDANRMAKEDKQEKKRVEAKNCLEGFINDVKIFVQRNLNWDIGDKLKLENALEEASEWFVKHENASKEDASKLNYDEMMQKLAQVYHPIVRKAYGRPAAMRAYW